MGVLNKVVARLPKPLQDSARRSGRFLRDKMYARQSTVKMLVSGFTLEIPRHHHLVGMQKSQPYRNLCVGITAKFVTEKYIDCHHHRYRRQYWRHGCCDCAVLR